MIPYFDAHCDTISALHDEGGELYGNEYHIDLRRAGIYSPYAQLFAVWGGSYEEKTALLKSELSKNSDRAVLCRSVKDAKKAAGEGRAAILLSVEGAEQLDCSIKRLRRARDEDGLIMINLCWNSDNALCGAAMDSGGGLSDAGRDFVRAAQDMGVVIDLSHASERTFWDVLEISARPLVASHSNSAALCSDFPRNLTDAQFTALVRTGGGAGLNLCPDFLGLGRDVDACAAHIERFLSLGGERAVFMGADLDGIGETPKGINGVEDVGKIYEALLRRNLPESLVRDIFYNNLMNILERAT